MNHLPNSHCKKHDEVEPQSNSELWKCPKCSKEHMQQSAQALPCGRKPLDVAFEKIAKIIKESKEVPFYTLPVDTSN